MVTTNMKKHSFVALAAVILVGAATSANAVILAPGGTSPNVAAATEPASVLVGAPLTVNITGIPDINPASSITERIYRQAGGTLDFYFQLTSAGGVFNGLIHQFNANFYSGYTTDVFWDNSPVVAGVITQAGNPLNGLASGTTIPDTFARTNSGNAVQFNFPDLPAVFGGSGPIQPGQTSKWLVIRTNATQVGPGVGGIINGITQNFNLLGPVPEPGSVIFGLGVLGVLGSRGVRRRKVA